jgi:uncharacterized protein YndB with AHSA1/START domain
VFVFTIKEIVDRKSLTTLSITIAIATIIIAATVWVTPKATAATLEKINASREISAPIYKVWNIVTDIENMTKYWTNLKVVENITKRDNITEIDVMGGPENLTGHQIVTLKPMQYFTINTTETEALPIPNMTAILTPISDNLTNIDIEWNIDMSKVPPPGRNNVKNNFMETTENAFNRIAQAAK